MHDVMLNTYTYHYGWVSSLLQRKTQPGQSVVYIYVFIYIYRLRPRKGVLACL